MAKVIEIQRTADGRRVTFNVEWIGHVVVSRFSDDFDHGAFMTRPWHICTFGRNFPTLEDCVKYLESIQEPSDDGGGRYNMSSECEAIYLGRE